jgi:hypothetical protein
MKIVAAVLMIALLLVPGVALAGSNDAALALGAFAVFNQIISGTGVFAGVGPVVVAPRPVYVAPQPVYVAPRPVYVAPPPVYVYRGPGHGYYRAHGDHGHHWTRHHDAGNWKHDNRNHRRD